MLVSKVIQITSGKPGAKQYERGKGERDPTACAVCLCTSDETNMRGSARFPQKVKKAEKDLIKRNKESVSRLPQTHTFTPAPPLPFSQGCSLITPLESVSLWVGPLPFNANTFVALDSAAIHIFCRRFTPHVSRTITTLLEQHKR